MGRWRCHPSHSQVVDRQGWQEGMRIPSETRCFFFNLSKAECGKRLTYSEAVYIFSYTTAQVLTGCLPAVGLDPSRFSETCGSIASVFTRTCTYVCIHAH